MPDYRIVEVVSRRDLMRFIKFPDRLYKDCLERNPDVNGLEYWCNKLNNGMGGADETIKGEFSVNGVNNPLSHQRGVISMARSMDYDSASSQFFICHADASFLDGQYAAFGQVTDGIEVVDAICENVMPIDGNGTVPRPVQPVIEKIEIVEE